MERPHEDRRGPDFGHSPGDDLTPSRMGWHSLTMKIALAQLNPTVGDLSGNRKLVEEAIHESIERGADLLVCPELVLTGYPPMDLLGRDGFVESALRELDALVEHSHRISIALGVPLPVEGYGPQRLTNSAVLLAGGRMVGRQAKTLLPAYDVFDERRYFVPADTREVTSLDRPDLGPIGLAVCEDAWWQELDYPVDPVADLVGAGARLVLNLSASPWHVGKGEQRRDLFSRLAREHGVPICFVNQVGGNDELIFDGGSFVVDARGEEIASLPQFEAGLAVVDLDSQETHCAAKLTRPAELERGLVLGIRDYFEKQGLPGRAVIGLSGGIDSAVTAHLAVEALGADGVLGILMPGPYSSDHSVEDARVLAEYLGIETRTVDIQPLYAEFRKVFAGLFGEQESYGLVDQNIQSRLRGATLMAVSNAEGRLVLATGNKSELSLGYCTLYGDLIGGLAVLGDVYKGDVYALARHANQGGERIPVSSIDKPPSAELAPDQTDQDDLPPYEVLDAVLEQIIEGDRNAGSIEPPPGADAQMCEQIARRLDRNEYKRRQGPVVLKTTTKAFGSGRRLPIVHRFGV